MEIKKVRPNCRIDGIASTTSAQVKAKSNPSVTNASKAVRRLKTRSPTARTVKPFRLTSLATTRSRTDSANSAKMFSFRFVA